MAGIYIHIPFCRQACHYCNFHFSTSLKYKNDFVAALLKEMELRRDYIAGEPVETIYFGGGTPSLLEASELEAIMDGLRSRFLIAVDAEVTLEANPDDFQIERLRAWKKARINRLSIGIQSFFAADLEWMNRAHDAGQAGEAIRLAQGEGVENISIDLIYGGPTLPDDHWKYNVDEAIRLGIPHLSCYALTVEPRTALDKMIHQHKKQDVDPDDQARQFLLLMDWTAAAGYEHYEISNFAKPGMRSRHNSSYWQGKTYLGLGPSAHSYNGVSREWNVANNARYINAMGGVAEGMIVVDPNPAGAIVEREMLTPVQRLNEYIMISLRTMEGCDLGVVADRWGEEAVAGLKGKAAFYIDGKKMKKLDNRLILTKEGKLLGDGITAALFWDDKNDRQ
ncbi:MAG TPA: radical SAM family heme chaperone HemW [Puia sp.]|nr:radical SAM family heme chaperone HemW [Puia sp.]